MNIQNLGSALEHWLGYQEKTGKEFMMNEDSLKYPIADYMVNGGEINVKVINLEHPHPNFSNRLMDLVVMEDTATKNLSYAFEFKIASVITRTSSEKQRIFNDLMRLHLANIASKKNCYFIIAGKAFDFLASFQQYPYYQKWFSFDKQDSVSFIVSSEIDTNYKEKYDEFAKKYSGKYWDPSNSKFNLPKQITTTCEYLTAYTKSYVGYMAGIWSVE